MPTARHFVALAVALLLLPVGTDVAFKASDPSSAAGLQLLLYQPFPYAYGALSVALFILLGWRSAKARGGYLALGAVAGAAIGIAWFAVAFLVVAQLHLSLGGGTL